VDVFADGDGVNGGMKNERQDLFDDALREIERQLFLETQVPSFRNSVAQTCLQVLYKWMSFGLIKTDFTPFLLFSR
jgi:hypothetical protein